MRQQNDKYSYIGLLLTGVMLIFVFPVAARARQPATKFATHTASEIQHRLGKINESIKSYHIQYTMRTLIGVPEYEIHRELYAHYPASYFHWSAKRTRLYTENEDPFRQLLRIDGTDGINEYPADRSFFRLTLRPNDSLPGSAPREFLFAALAWWPLTVFTPPESTPGTPIVLAEIAKSNKYVVRPRQELIDGRWCHVLEYADHDCLWIDLDRGCAVLLRETRDPASNALVQKIESYEHAEVVPGLWAAKRFRNLLFDRANPQKKTVDAEAVIRLIEVNQPIAPEVFIFKPSPGSIEISSGRHFSQVVPGGADLLDEMVARLNRYKPTGNDSGGGPSDASSWAINIVSCICVVAIACIGGWRRASVE